MERIKKWCDCTFRLLRAISIIVFLLLASHYIYEHKNSISDFYSDLDRLNGACFWDMITAIATVVAAICAYRAYRQSIKTREHSSFDSIFTQLLSNMQSYINKATLQTTIVKDPWVEVCNTCVKVDNRDYNTFLNFCNIYKNYTNKKNKKLGKNKITKLWEVYTKNLVNRSDFSNCFKYFYHIIDTVCQSPLDDARRKQYIGIIQAQLNYDILFCYLINQIVYLYVHPNKKRYPKLLKEYDFFKDLCKHGDYGAIIKSTIDEDILRPFLHKKTFKSLFGK